MQVVGPGTTLPAAVAITVGYSHTCALLDDRTGWCWGYELEGALGAGTFGSSNGQLMPMLEITDLAAVTAGRWGTCARLANGTVWCMGQNAYGQLGDGTFARSTVPVEVPDVLTSGD